MSLGRPAMRGREAREKETIIRLHAEYMRRLQAAGLSQTAASTRAYHMVKAPGRKYIEPGYAPVVGRCGSCGRDFGSAASFDGNCMSAACPWGLTPCV